MIMKKLMMFVMTVAFFFVSQIICAEIDGIWVGAVEGRDSKKLELTYRFKAEGGTLIGLIESRLGGGPISDGKIDGKNIEFRLNAGTLIIMNSGTLSGDEIHIMQTTGEEKIRVVLKRVKYDR